MQEFAIKLSYKQGLSDQQQVELEKEEEKYNRLMKNLSEMKELQQQSQSEFKRRKEDL